jgi:hypothetical protein
MDRKNYAARKDIDSGVLRQRRDLYGVSIALMLYYLAGGALEHTLNLSLLPLRFDSPCVFLYAAWAGFFYFLVRYWLLAPHAWKYFTEDAIWQTGQTKAGKLVAKNVAPPPPTHIQPNMDVASEIDLCSPRLIRHEGKYCVDFTHMRTKADDGYLRFHNTMIVTIRESDLGLFHRARLYGFFLALFRERGFTDYLMPYIFAGATVVVAVVMSLRAKVCLCALW